MSGSVRIRADILAASADLARREPHSECCGLLAGCDGTITAIFPATNAAPDPASSYEIAPEELFRLMRAIRAAKLELMGICHSHPTGSNEPSPRDVERAYYPGAAYFIASPRPDAVRRVRAFSIRDGRVAELEIEVV